MANKVTYESRLDKATEKVQSKPQKVLNYIGAFLVKELKLVTAKANRILYIVKSDGTKTEIPPGKMQKGNKYKVFKKENMVQVGNIVFWSKFFEFGTSTQAKAPFLVPTAQKNVNAIKQLVEATYKELDTDDDNTIHEFTPPADENRID